MPLFDYRQYFGADSHIKQKVGDIFQPTRHLVDIKFALTRAVIAAGNFHLLGNVGYVGDTNSRRHMVQSQGDFGPVHWFAGRTAVEYEIDGSRSAKGF